MYYWYTDPSGGTPAFMSGNSYTTPTWLPAGVYDYYVAAVSNCESVTRQWVTITIKPIPAPPALLPSDTTICPGTSVTLKAVGESSAVINWYDAATGGTLLWTGPNYTVSPSGLTKYYVTQTLNSCVSNIDSAQVNVGMVYVPKLVTGSYCNGSAGYYFYGNGYTYPEGTYTGIIITSETETCDTAVTLVVVKNPTYSVNIFDTICYGGSYLFDGNYYTSAGIYSMTLHTVNGCDSVINLHLSLRAGCQTQTINVANDYYEVTYGDAPFNINVSASSGLPVTLFNVSGTSVSVSGGAAGVYSITTQRVGTTVITFKQTGNNYYAPVERTVTVLVRPAKLTVQAKDITVPLHSLPPVFTYNCIGLLNNDSDAIFASPYHYPEFNCSAPLDLTGRYKSMGEYAIIPCCAQAENYDIEYREGILKIKGAVGKLPNAFTPYAQNGFNDVFGEGYELKIFNRWGVLLHSSKSGWDGKYKGQFVMPGVYYYHAIDAEGGIYKGSVTILKQH
jgi:gliding motility-associated-like protein